MVLTSFAGVLLTWHCLLSLADQLVVLDAAEFAELNSMALNGAGLAATVLGVVAAKVPTDSLNTQSGATYAAGAVMPVIIRGPARINIGAANTVAAGDLLTTSAVAKVAQTNAGAPGANANTMSLIAIAMEANTAKDANNTIRCYINK